MEFKTKEPSEDGCRNCPADQEQSFFSDRRELPAHDLRASAEYCVELKRKDILLKRFEYLACCA